MGVVDIDCQVSLHIIMEEIKSKKCLKFVHVGLRKIKPSDSKELEPQERGKQELKRKEREKTCEESGRDLLPTPKCLSLPV